MIARGNSAKAVDGGHRPVDADSGNCLAVKDGSRDAGARVQQNFCDSALAQRWTFQAANATSAHQA
ncbi:RICIN domain-containing protein [Streptomyces virginiae]|uniref:RICIN domain-containing protein n=1 Tax=Streptomyces virginiae TaxID=1961 RepID=UPI0036384F42